MAVNGWYIHTRKLTTADVSVTKAVTPTVAQAGDWLTYTLVFANQGAVPAANTIMTDLLHPWLVNPSYALWTSYASVPPLPTGHYV